jgi:microcystin-dependent protein
MAGLAVRPSYQLTETDILTVDKINLMATPVVDLSLETPVNDQNYFRNGNFYSSFWTNPAGVPVPPGSWVGNADYWLCSSAAGTPTYQRSSDVPDLFSLFSAQLVGAAGVGVVEFGSQISGDLSATLRRRCTFSGYIENKTGQPLNPQLLFYTCAAFNNFSAVSLQATIDLQTCANAMWTYVTGSQDVSTLANAANGLLIAVLIPAGSLAATTQTVNFSRLKFQIGDVATEFVDDPSLFIQTPSIDSTMLQDGCIARPTLFAPNVIPKGAFVAGAIQTADIGDHQVTGVKLASTAVADSLGYTPINKSGDTAVGVIGFTQDTPVLPSGIPAIVVSTTATNASNPSYDPAIGFSRTGVNGRYIGLAPDRRFRTMDDAGVAGYLLDTVTGVDTNSYQNASITIQKLAQSLINIVVPPGMVRIFAGPNIPPGWLACDGSAYSQSQYPALYAAIGTYWGAGTGGQQFNVPDLRGRSPLGYVNSAIVGVTARAFASLGGEENHVLAPAELASHVHGVTDNGHGHPGSIDTGHNHGVTDPGHTHTVGGATMQGGSGGVGLATAPPAVFTSANTTGIAIQNGTAHLQIANGKTNISIQAFGSNGGHNNMSPFAVMYFIIKT